MRADGIILPPEHGDPAPWSDSDSGIFSGTEEGSDTEEEDSDPSDQWQDIHQAVKSTIIELGGKVVPKLNWSAPKDATWINATNSMDCQVANDIYLLLKSSDFITHDLEHPFDDCDDAEMIVPSGGEAKARPDTSMIDYHLVLRKHVMFNPAVEFRCFVRNGTLIGICQRDVNHFDYLRPMEVELRKRIQTFFQQRLRDTFPDPNFVFDVYIPPPHHRVWLIDINPWAQRTDPLLFSWLELLTMPDYAAASADSAAKGFVRLSLKEGAEAGSENSPEPDLSDEDETEAYSSWEYQPEFRLIKKDDPEAYSFSTPQYSAHKLPRDVVDASEGGPGPLREFAQQWKEVLAKRQAEEEHDDAEE